MDKPTFPYNADIDSMVTPTGEFLYTARFLLGVWRAAHRTAPHAAFGKLGAKTYMPTDELGAFLAGRAKIRRRIPIAVRTP